MANSVRKQEKVMMAAIDFGTTFSGYTFAIQNNYMRDPDKITDNRWSPSKPTTSI